MLRRSRGKPIRIASKSVRSRPVLERLLDLDPGFQGVLTFTLPETLWLWERGLRDLVLAYPTTDRAGLTRLARVTSEDPEEAPVVMVDCIEHLDLIEEAASLLRRADPGRDRHRPLLVAARRHASRSVRSARRSGPRRQAVALAQEIEQRERTSWSG